MRWILPFVLACAPVTPEEREAVWIPMGAATAPRPGELALDVGGGVLGARFEFTVTGANAGDQVYILRSTAGLGPGPCLGALGGACLDIAAPAVRHTALWTDADGFGEMTTPTPREGDLLGAEVCFQAAVQRGFGGVLSELSAPDCVVLDRDSDGDGRADGEDPCPDDPLDGCVVEDWVFGAYDGPTEFDPGVQYNGDVSCSETCGDVGRVAIGARWVCNHWDGGESEGCGPWNHGEWTPDHCSEQILDGVYVAGDNPACGNEGRLRDAVDSAGNDPWTWHAFECQCG